MEAGLPHINQTAYRHAVSCEDTVFATQKLLLNISERVVERICVCMTCRKLLI